MQEKLIQHYLESNSNYIDEICAKPDLLEKVFRLETSLRSSNKKKKKEKLNDRVHPIEERKLLQLAEDFVSRGRAAFQKTNQDIWQHILSDNLLFSHFQDLISFISTREMTNNKTPPHLKKIVQKNIFKTSGSDRNIIIEIKDSLRLLNQDPGNLFQLPLLQEVISTRYVENLAFGGDTLQFLSKGEDIHIIFQILKDGEDTVTMILKLSESSALPTSITLSRGGRDMQKNTSVTRVIHFNHLQQGDYQIELAGKADSLPKTINISLVSNFH